MQVPYETDHEMARNVASYRERLAETPVEIEVGDRPSVNVVQSESWVELRPRYPIHPWRGTRVRNDLYAGILDRFNDHPDRIDPLGRNRQARARTETTKAASSLQCL